MQTVSGLLDTMQDLLGASTAREMPEAWHHRPDLRPVGDGGYWDVETPEGVVTCLVGADGDTVNSVVAQGIAMPDDDPENRSLTVAWDDVSEEVSAWVDGMAADPLAQAERWKTGIGWEVSTPDPAGIVVHRIAPGTPPYRAEPAPVADHPKPFWSLIFLHEGGTDAR